MSRGGYFWHGRHVRLVARAPNEVKVMVEEVAFTEVIPRADGEYGLFLRNSRAWEVKLTAELAETIRHGLPTALGGEVRATVDLDEARPV